MRVACQPWTVHVPFMVTVAGTGTNFPDALAGGVLAAENGSVMLLTASTSLPDSVRAKLASERDWIGDVYYLGGLGAISQNVRDQVAAILY